jgi:hypothetical protein
MSTEARASFRKEDWPRPELRGIRSRPDEVRLTYTIEPDSEGIHIQSRDVNNDEWKDAYSDIGKNASEPEHAREGFIDDQYISIRHKGASRIEYRAKYVYHDGVIGEWSEAIQISLQ